MSARGNATRPRASKLTRAAAAASLVWRIVNGRLYVNWTATEDDEFFINELIVDSVPPPITLFKDWKP